MKSPFLFLILCMILQNVNAQKVGIGNPDPQYELDVNGNSASDNQVSVIHLWQAGSQYVMNNTFGQDLSNCEAAIDPALYSATGDIEVKLIIRINSTTAVINNFQLRAHNGIAESFPILFSDTWSYTNPQSGTIAESQWKTWAAGIIPQEIHLFGWVDSGATNFISAYLMIRPKR